MKSIVDLTALLALLAATHPAWAQAPAKEYKIVWKKTIVDPAFRSEGVAVADVNGDGKKDILVGDVWYGAPDWKPRPIRKEKTYNGKSGYSESFAVFAEDIDKDGHVDQIVVGFPGAPCHWYKNPGKGGGPWQPFVIQDSACNETPIYVDLFGAKQKGLLLGHKGEMAYFSPDSDPAKPWRKISISGPFKADPKVKPAVKNFPGTDKYNHGLGAGDVNGDGKLDVLVAGGWWEQPAANAVAGAWNFHPLALPECADMFAFDIDGDGKNDIISTAAHATGIWWHQQKEGKDHPTFITRTMFPIPKTLAKAPDDHKFSKDEADLYAALSKIRSDERKVPWRTNLKLCRDARSNVPVAAAAEGKFEVARSKYEGEFVATDHGVLTRPEYIARAFFDKYHKLKDPGLEVGVGVFDGASGKKHYLILIGDREQFATPGQTHALHFVDINGDGLKDLVTGRRFWAHGPGGDDTPGDPAALYWFKAKKDKSGFTSFDPQLVDDDSGVGTQFAVEDINGDGLLDIIVSNKRGVFVFLQDREEVIRPVPPPDEN